MKNFSALNYTQKLLSTDASANRNQTAHYFLGNAYLKTDDPDAKVFDAVLGETNKTAYGSLALVPHCFAR